MILLAVRLVLIAICGFLWRLGGAAGFSKGFRRYGCPGAILVSLFLTQNWIGLISIPLLIGAFSLGYGENSKLSNLLGNKYLVRLVCGLAYSIASLPILWGNWCLFCFHVAVCSIGVMLAGNQKFQFEDIREEGFIGLCVASIPIFA